MEANKLGYPSLREILDDIELTTAFKLFLNKLHSVENLSFWLEVEAFKKMPPSKLQEYAQAIYQKYVSSISSDGLNVDSSLKDELSYALLSGNIRNDLFDEMQDAVYILLELDSYRKFIQSDEFKKLMGMLDNIIPQYPLIFNNKNSTKKRKRILLGSLERRLRNNWSVKRIVNLFVFLS